MEFLALGVLPLTIGIGYWLGIRHERERVAEEAERMSRIDPPNRRPGLPTNLDAEPSVVHDPRIRRAHWNR